MARFRRAQLQEHALLLHRNGDRGLLAANAAACIPPAAAGCKSNLRRFERSPRLIISNARPHM